MYDIVMLVVFGILVPVWLVVWWKVIIELIKDDELLPFKNTYTFAGFCFVVLIMGFLVCALVAVAWIAIIPLAIVYGLVYLAIRHKEKV